MLMAKIVSLPRNYTLADLLRIDPIGALYRHFDSEFSFFTESHTAQTAVSEKVILAMRNAFKADPTLLAQKDRYRLNTEAGRRAIALLLQVPEEDVLCTFHYQRQLTHAVKTF